MTFHLVESIDQVIRLALEDVPPVDAASLGELVGAHN
jgi:hypothetical protein